MPKFKYQGQIDSSVTLNHAGKLRDVVLLRGSTHDLPDTHDYVKTLVKLGHLTPVAEAVAIVTEAAAPESIETTKKGGK